MEVKTIHPEDEGGESSRILPCRAANEISGIILYLETVLEFHLAGFIAERGIVPGVRANGELSPLPSSPTEFIVQGLDGLLARLQAAHAAGQGREAALEIHADTLAGFMAISQQAGLVPIVEPDVEFSEGVDLSRSAEVHERTVELTYEKCRRYNEGTSKSQLNRFLGTLIKLSSSVQPADIALATATVISRTILPAIPGALILSGRLAPTIAVEYLTALNRLVNSSSVFSQLPRLSFSYGRALQREALKHWVIGVEEGARKVFQKWSKTCFRAAKGEDI